VNGLQADLVLEGGGVKGIGLVGAASVLAGAGYTFERIAGTSAGAIVGALLAAGMSVAELREEMAALDYQRFKDESLLDRVPVFGKPLSLIFERGVYEGKFLVEWLGERLARHGVETFGDLRRSDAGSSLPPWLEYKLVVVAADLSRGEMVRLPWDYEDRYGLNPDEQRVVDAVRASMSIPFFFEPATLKDAQGRTATLVDGGMLSNFPIAMFDRTDGAAARWPTLGLKLSARPDAAQFPNETGNPFAFLKAMVDTMVSGHDRMHIADECVQARTIFIDTFKISATKFDLSHDEQDALLVSGNEAAARFLKEWNFEAYKAECRA
jgi:NTE family protein